MSKYSEIIKRLGEVGVLARQDDQGMEPRSRLPQGITGDPFAIETFDSLEGSSSWLEALDERRSREFSSDVGQDFDEDALAWYLSFHFNSDKCGIYLTDFGIDFIADWILKDYVESASEVTSEQYRWALHEAAQVLLDHERFHHKFEVAVANLELISGTRIFVPSRLSRDRTIQHLEEALATAEMIRGGRPPRATERLFDGGASIRKRLNSHPPGYRDAGSYTSNTDFRRGRISLLENVHPMMISSPNKSHRILLASYDSLFSRNTRLHRVGNDSALSRALGEAVSLYQRLFRPDEIISGLVNNFDYAIVSKGGKGSHTKLESTRQGCPMQLIPRTNPVSPTVMTSVVVNLGYQGRRREMFRDLGLL